MNPNNNQQVKYSNFPSNTNDHYWWDEEVIARTDSTGEEQIVEIVDWTTSPTGDEEMVDDISNYIQPTPPGINQYYNTYDVYTPTVPSIDEVHLDLLHIKVVLEKLHYHNKITKSILSSLVKRVDNIHTSVKELKDGFDKHEFMNKQVLRK
jgi:hypothetical protein